jgi:Dynamin central region/Dynamin GTPase effector domain
MDNSQDKSAVAEVRDLVQSYMVQERTIILVVVPSTQDVATVEALEWAARYDSSGQRTIGCMTKPDLVDVGAEDETIAVLTNQRKPLTLGYVMLRNRNQREVSEGILNLEARRREAAFFEASPAFSDVDRSLLGVEQLVAKLTSVLVSRIYAALPSMRNEIVRKLDRATAELDELGTGAGSTDSEAGVTLMRIVFEYHSLLQDTCQGRYVDKRLWSPKTRLCTRAQALYDKFKAEVVSTRPDFDNTVVDLVEAEIRESRGRELPGFLNPRIFESRVARFVEDWRAASARLITALRKMIVEVTSELLASLAPEFPALRLRMRDLVGEAIRQLEEDGRREVGSVFSRETEGVFTMNDQFLNEVNARRLARFDQAVIVALARAGRDSRSNSREKDVATLIRGWYQEHYCAGVTERTRADAEDMVVMLSVYWDVASRRFVDSHVMALDGSMIRMLPERAYVPLNAMVLESSGKATGADHLSVAQLLREDEATMTKRKTLIERKSRLEKARELVDKF